MNCQEYLAMLETGSLRDLSPDSPLLRHCATCPDCSQVTTALRDREYEAASLLNTLPPLTPPAAVAEAAVGLSHRRRMGRVAVMFSGAALVASIWIAAQTIFFPMMDRADASHATLRTETIPLSCLSPAQAADIIQPYVRTRGSTYYLPTSGIAAITVRGTTRELSKARELISEFEHDPTAACRNRSLNVGSGTPDPAPSASTRPVIAGGKVSAEPKTP